MQAELTIPTCLLTKQRAHATTTSRVFAANFKLMRARTNKTDYTTHHVNIGADPYHSGILHTATMTDLDPSTTYFYTCGDVDLGLSAVRDFQTPAMVGLDQAVTIGVLGDLGQTNDSM